MFKDLKNKIVIITGGLGFLGKQIVNAYHKEGSKIIVLDRKKKITSKKFDHYSCDICDENIWDDDMKWSECGWDDREWEFICKACFTKHKGSEEE